MDKDAARLKAKLETLKNGFKHSVIKIEVFDIDQLAMVTRYEVQPA